jgi:hypothetical protein
LGYQWIFHSTNSTNVYFTSNSPLAIANVQLTNAGTYYVVVTNLYGTATSSNAVLTIGYAPFIVTHPASQTALQFTPATFSVVATGSVALVFQWQRNGANIAQATNSSYTITNVQTTSSGSYRVVITNQFGTVTSSNGVLTPFVPNVRLENTTGTLGLMTVPVRIVAGGNENSMTASVNFPTNYLTYTSASLGSNAAGALLTVNASSASSGKLGLSVFFADASNFGVGTQEVARITFQIPIITNQVVTQMQFGDVPLTRQLLETNSHPLVTTYSNAIIVLNVADLEGDVSPRTNGNRSLNVSDWTQVGRFVAGLDAVSNTLEFLRADCAPRTNGGDGRLSIADWVQAGRYSFAFDSPAAIGGPSNFTVAQTPKAPTRPASLVLLSQSGVTNTIAVHLNTQGDENALGFSLHFDPTQLNFVSAGFGAGVSGAIMNVNSSQAASGNVGVAIALGTGNTLAAGDVECARVTFVSSGFGSYTANFNFADQPILREIADANATTESASYTGLSFTVTGQPLPQLFANLQGTNVVVSWTTASAGFNLESTSTLSTNWSPATYTPATNGSSIVVTQGISADQLFYRLHHP